MWPDPTIIWEWTELLEGKIGEVLGIDDGGLSVSLDKTIPGKVGIQVGNRNAKGHGIRRKREMTVSLSLKQERPLTLC